MYCHILPAKKLINRTVVWFILNPDLLLLRIHTVMEICKGDTDTSTLKDQASKINEQHHFVNHSWSVAGSYSLPLKPAGLAFILSFHSIHSVRYVSLAPEHVVPPYSCVFKSLPAPDIQDPTLINRYRSEALIEQHSPGPPPTVPLTAIAIRASLPNINQS